MKKVIIGLVFGFILALPLGAYASAYITSADVVDGSLQGVDHRDGTIFARKIKNGAINSAKIYDGSVKTRDIANGAITAAKINRIGLDADLLDGKHGDSFSAIAHNHDTSYSPSGHNHDERYYTVAEMNTFFNYFNAFEDWCWWEHGYMPSSLKALRAKAKAFQR